MNHIFKILAALLIALSTSAQLQAQGVVQIGTLFLPLGDATHISANNLDLAGVRFNVLYSGNRLQFVGSKVGSAVASFSSDIESVSSVCEVSGGFYCFVKLFNREIHRVFLSSADLSVAEHIVSPGTANGSLAQTAQLIGDDLYLLTKDSIFVSRDTAASWQADMAGLPSSGTLIDACLDSEQMVYLATSNGVYTQPPASNIWTKLAGSPSAAISNVFVDQRRRIWIYSASGAELSTDGGNTFIPAGSGLSGASCHFTADGFGNVYALTSINGADGGEAVFYSHGGTADFVRVDQSIQSDFAMVAGSPYTSIHGDSSLYLGTVAGLYRSSDQGTTWLYEPNFDAQRAISYIPQDGGDLLTTGVGAFRMKAGGWQKVFPTVGYVKDAQLMADFLHGARYLLATDLYRSTDSGNNWSIDSVGYSAVAGPTFVDGKGTLYTIHEQYLAGVGNVTQVWRRPFGGVWTYDENGLPDTLDYRFVVGRAGTDVDGSALLRITTIATGSTTIYKRDESAGKWVVSSTFAERLFNISDGGGISAGSADRGVVLLVNGAWEYVPTPSGVKVTDLSASIASVAPSGRLWSWYETIDFNNPGQGGVGRGVYYSDDQQTWKKVGLDSIQITQLITSGDSVIALTKTNGAFVIRVTDNGGVAINKQEPSLSLFPNPANRLLSIPLAFTPQRIATVRVQDELGREVLAQRLAIPEGPNPVLTLDVQTLSAGTYYCQVAVGPQSRTGKFIIE